MFALPAPDCRARPNLAGPRRLAPVNGRRVRMVEQRILTGALTEMAQR